MSDFYIGGATILHPLSREVLKPIVQKLFEQIDKECLSYPNSEEFLDALLAGKNPSANWMVYPEDCTSEDDENYVYVSVNISVKPIDDKSFKCFFIPNPLCMPHYNWTDFSWHFKKFLELTNPLKIGACLFEDVSGDNVPCLKEWGVYTWCHPLTLNIMNFNKEKHHDYVLKMQSVLNLVVNKLSTLGWQIQSYDFSEKTLNDLEFSLYAKSAESSIQIRYTEDEVHIIPLGNKPTNLRPCLEILAIVCEGASMSYIEANNMTIKDLRF